MSTTSGKAPSLAWALGLAGVIPFVATAVTLVVAPPNLAGPALLALLTYACAVLSFLGGARWGAEVATPEPRGGSLAVAVLPALAGWALLTLPLSQPQHLGGFAVAFLAQWLWDVRSSRLPGWYRRLRTMLTLGAVGSLLLALARAAGII